MVMAFLSRFRASGIISNLRCVLRGPVPCALCRRRIEGTAPACPACLADLPWRHWALTPATHRLVLDARLPVYAAFAYRFPLDRIIAKVKAGGTPRLLDYIVRLAITRLPEEIGLLLRGAAPCAVPTAPRRLRRRQIDLPRQLTQGLGSALGTTPIVIPFRASDARHAAQHGLGRAARRALRIKPLDDWSGLAGARLLLVDDVCTTGATLAAHVLALEEAGATIVAACVLALADPPRGSPDQTSRFTTDSA